MFSLLSLGLLAVATHALPAADPQVGLPLFGGPLLYHAPNCTNGESVADKNPTLPRPLPLSPRPLSRPPDKVATPSAWLQSHLESFALSRRANTELVIDVLLLLTVITNQFVN